MRRSIIEIDESLCDGCGICVEACAEGAIQLVEGKARVVKDEYCDGLGACVGDCPQGALRVVEREASAYDEAATESHVAEVRGAAGLARMRQAARAQADPPALPHRGHGGGCPGARVVSREPRSAAQTSAIGGAGLPPRVNASDLSQWPVQLHLVPTRAPFFQDRELVLLSTCGPVASADVHWRFLRGRAVVVACPKLDHAGPYAGKLARIFGQNSIPRVIVVRMQVPCCGGLTQIALQAREMSGRGDLELVEVVIALDGSVLGERRP